MTTTGRKTLICKTMRSGDSIPADAEVVNTDVDNERGGLRVWYFEMGHG